MTKAKKTKAKKTKAKKTKVLARTRLDALASKLRTVLRRQTTDIIEAGKILLEIKDELGHREWLPWLAKNFDLSERTAQRYIAAAEYADGKSDTMADFANLAPGILYSLANGFYDDKEEAAILAATREGRVDDDCATAICEALEPPAPPDSDGGDGNDGGGDDDAEDGGGKAEDAPAEDAETKQILDGPPPAMPPAPDPTPTNYALQSFDDAVSQLKRLSTKPLPTFADTKHSADDLEGVERLLGSVITHKRSTSTQAATQVGDDVFLKMSRNQSENPDQTD